MPGRPLRKSRFRGVCPPVMARLSFVVFLAFVFSGVASGGVYARGEQGFHHYGGEFLRPEANC